MGQLTLVGPHRHQQRTCVAGQTCGLRSLTGQHLQTDDQMVILDTCGAGGTKTVDRAFDAHTANPQLNVRPAVAEERAQQCDCSTTLN